MAKDNRSASIQADGTACLQPTRRARRHWAALAALLSCLLVPVVSAEPIHTESGLVEGIEDNGVRVFRVIPFAAPPVGPLRWRAPSPAAAWEGVRIADRFSPICLQPGSYPDDAPAEPMSEDCLYLNVWAPANPEGRPFSASARHWASIRKTPSACRLTAFIGRAQVRLVVKSARQPVEANAGHVVRARVGKSAAGRERHPHTLSHSVGDVGASVGRIVVAFS